MKGKVLDDDEPIPNKSKVKVRPTRAKTHTTHPIHAAPTKTHSQQVSTKNPFRFPSITNEEVFETKFQEAASTDVQSKKFKLPGGAGDSVFTYSTIKFSGDDEDDDDDRYIVKAKQKPPKRSTSPIPSQYYNLEQTFNGQQVKFDSEIDGVNSQYGDGFKPSGKFTNIYKGQKSGKPLFKSTEDDFKDEEYYDFSIRPPRQGQSSVGSGPSGKYGKLKSDLGVKGLAIKAYKNKFDPQLQGGFKPSFKLRDFPHLHGAETGSGIASPGQIKTYYRSEESERDERIKHKLSNDPHPASKAQFAQFLRAKEDERLERLVEEQFKLQQQKQIAQEKEAELQLQQQVLQRQKEKLKQVEKHLSGKVTRQAARQKRRPVAPSHPSHTSRRQRNPSPLNFSVSGNGQSAIPLRTVSAKDGTYRVSFNV